MRRSGSRCATWLAKNNSHVAEVAPDGLERRLAHPVLAAKLRIVHPDGRGRYAAQRDGVFGKRVPDASSVPGRPRSQPRDRKSTRLNSSHSQISYAVFCLKKKKTT